MLPQMLRCAHNCQGQFAMIASISNLDFLSEEQKGKNFL